MPRFGRRSRRNLATCDPEIILFCEELIKIVDFSVICGFRDKEAQNEAYNSKPRRSWKKWPESKHNIFPSPAVDLAPWPIDWEDTERFAYFAGYAMRQALLMGFDFIWGGDWDGDFDIQEHRLIDMPHFEKKVVI